MARFERWLQLAMAIALDCNNGKKSWQLPAAVGRFPPCIARDAKPLETSGHS
jgi:hypothetical protein